MAKYKKRADGRYATTVALNGIDGKVTKTVYGKTIKELEQKIAELKTNGIVANSDINITDFSRKWLNVYKKNTVEKNTYAGYEICVNTHIIPNKG